MFEPLKKLLPLAYLAVLLLALYAVYTAFGGGLRRGEFEGRYYPPDTLRAGAAAAPAEEVYLVDLLESTPEQVNAGRLLFQQNCVSCHGSDGRGDGPKAAGLNPPPRNFTAEKFKNGAASLQIFNTLGSGIPGSSMASFSYLNVRERMALAHYVRTFVPDPPPNPQELVDQLPQPAGASIAVAPAATPSTGTAAQTASPQARPLSLKQAERLLLAEATGPENATAAAAPEVPAGGVYAARCAACHGPAGQGAVVSLRVPNTGLIYYRTRPLGFRYRSADSLGRFLAAGIPGLPGHRFGELRPEECRELLAALGRLDQP